MLEVSSSNMGLLIPRISITSTAKASPVTSPKTSLLIYNTATAGDVTPGYYYWDSKWVRLTASVDPEVNHDLVIKTINAALLQMSLSISPFPIFSYNSMTSTANFRGLFSLFR